MDELLGHDWNTLANRASDGRLPPAGRGSRDRTQAANAQNDTRVADPDFPANLPTAAQIDVRRQRGLRMLHDIEDEQRARSERRNPLQPFLHLFDHDPVLPTRQNPQEAVEQHRLEGVQPAAEIAAILRELEEADRERERIRRELRTARFRMDAIQQQINLIRRNSGRQPPATAPEPVFGSLSGPTPALTPAPAPTSAPPHVPVDADGEAKPKVTEKIVHDYCAICKEKLENPYKTACDHVFCEECIMTWLQNGAAEKLECPLCRTSL